MLSAPAQGYFAQDHKYQSSGWNDPRHHNEWAIKKTLENHSHHSNAVPQNTPNAEVISRKHWRR